jgi:hypothetical protein
MTQSFIFVSPAATTFPKRGFQNPCFRPAALGDTSISPQRSLFFGTPLANFVASFFLDELRKESARVAFDRPPGDELLRNSLIIQDCSSSFREESLSSITGPFRIGFQHLSFVPFVSFFKNLNFNPSTPCAN